MITLLACSSYLFAQTEQGNIRVGATSNLSFTSTSYEEGDNDNEFGLEGSVGYFVIDNLAVGLNLGFTSTSGSFESSSFVAGPAARYYFQGVFAGAGILFGKQTIDFGDPIGKVDANGNFIALEAGYAAFITDNVSIEPSLGYTIAGGDFDGNTFGLNIGFGIYF